ncbi:hypothetical protein ALC56_08663 [Trachymyrmex septentrionalis]|uniref:Transmembrane protein n=1 Tax=Trachymyrmex septentrionalis TaxID=34720 RepID=A0A195F9I4_9HYME|nr:hypothetical protein ALC56_08663 [Trachymyrmex septentrionalis]
MHVRGRVCVACMRTPRETGEARMSSAEGRETEERRMEKRARRTASQPQRLTKKKDGRFNSLIAQRSERRRAGAGYDGEGGSAIGSSEVVNGGRGRCEKSPRKKCARDEAKQRGEGRPGSGVARNLRTETTQPALFFFFLLFFLFFLRPSDYRCLSLFFFSHQRRSARACDARISCDVGSAATSSGAVRVRASERTSSGVEETTCTFFRILAIFYATSHALVRTVQIDINMAYT